MSRAIVGQWKWLRTKASVAPTPACLCSVWTSARSSGTMPRGTAKTGLLSLGVYHTRFFSSIKYRSCSGHVFFSTQLIMICFKKGSLFCCAASRDVSVSAFRARSMADAVSAGASVAVEELATPPPLLKGHRLFLRWPRRMRLGPYRFF